MISLLGMLQISGIHREASAAERKGLWVGVDLFTRTPKDLRERDEIPFSLVKSNLDPKSGIEVHNIGLIYSAQSTPAAG
jgi:hypothetical protein